MKLRNFTPFVLISSLLVISACKKNDSSSPTQACKISSQTANVTINISGQTPTNSTEIETFSYNSDGSLYQISLSNASGSSQGTVVYVNGQPTSINYGANQVEYFTVSNGHLTKDLYPDGSYAVYTYDGSGNLVEEDDYKNKDTLSGKATYTYDGNGNVATKNVYTSLTTVGEVRTYSNYDSKPNYNLATFYNHPEFGLVAFPSKNNPGLEVITYPNSTGQVTQANVYQYNNSGAVTKVTQTATSGANTGTETISIGYSGCN